MLAQEAPEGEAGRSMFDGLVGMAPLLLIVVLFYFLLIRPQRREQAKRDDLLRALKKNDRVVTIGGIIGTIANIAPDSKEVTLKVDDNTRLRMLRSAIQTVLRDDEAPTDGASKT